MFDPYAPLLAVAVLCLDLTIGQIRARFSLLPGPPIVLARIGLALSRRLDRPNRTARTLRFRGALLVVCLGGAALLAGIALQMLAARLPFPYGLAIDGLILWSCIRAYRPLGRLREAVRRIGEDSDSVATGRTVLEQTAISFVHFVVVPFFWFLLTGLPGLLVAAASWALERAAQESAQERGANRRTFGAAAVKLHNLLSWIPSRVADVVLAVASGAVPRGRPVAALRQGWGHARLGELGTVAALAGGLGVTLPARVSAGSQNIWLGGGNAQVGRNDLLRAIWLYVVALLVVAALLILVALLQQL
jgi:adenosylcobinamide-phosphate synthase